MAKVTLQDGSVFEGTNEELVELFTKLGAKIPAVEEAEEPAQLQVGDYVVSTSEDRYGTTNTDMKLAKVTRVFKDGEIVIEIIAHADESNIGDDYSVETAYFRKATDEEIAEAKWASINRKPNEFKEGDIVRVIESPHALPVGTIFEVKSVDSDGDIHDHRGYMYMAQKNRVELITPVEARFDR